MCGVSCCDVLWRPCSCVDEFLTLAAICIYISLCRFNSWSLLPPPTPLPLTRIHPCNKTQTHTHSLTLKYTGQAPALVNAVTRCLQSLHSLQDYSSGSNGSNGVLLAAALPLLAAPLVAVLDALPVDLTTAAAVAAAAQQLLQALSSSSGYAAAAAMAGRSDVLTSGGGSSGGGGGSVTVLLMVYSAVLRWVWQDDTAGACVQLFHACSIVRVPGCCEETVLGLTHALLMLCLQLHLTCSYIYTHTPNPTIP